VPGRPERGPRHHRHAGLLEQPGGKRLVIRDILSKARDQVWQTVNTTMVTAYWNMRSFYMTYPILEALRRKLSWTHYRLLLKVDKPEARSFYEVESVNARWSTRELDRQINSLLFERLACFNSGQRVEDHFDDVTEMIEIGKVGQREIKTIPKEISPS